MEFGKITFKEQRNEDRSFAGLVITAEFKNDGHVGVAEVEYARWTTNVKGVVEQALNAFFKKLPMPKHVKGVKVAA